ncbi:FixH family protein [Acanthopleuribacter pedis]|uniref:FixH family protein n=1 Tax=Acanthopleuribacter pedis TaxID=442870 RepID=A0A8J7Q3Z7_9BACT|nr:FixH family protein [Acanthopleuribacter pedis]MBO1317904.1 FixH family protein [Acanthopleuribacter pedis]
MNYWKYIVMSLLGACMVFHLSAVYYISGRNFELTSKDYYAHEQVYQQTLDTYRAARDWTMQHRFDDSGRFLVHLVGPNPEEAVKTVSATLVRPNGSAADLQLDLEPAESGWWSVALPNQPASGNWNLGVAAQTDQGPIAFRRKIRVD